MVWNMFLKNLGLPKLNDCKIYINSLFHYDKIYMSQFIYKRSFFADFTHPYNFSFVYLSLFTRY